MTPEERAREFFGCDGHVNKHTTRCIEWPSAGLGCREGAALIRSERARAAAIARAEKDEFTKAAGKHFTAKNYEGERWLMYGRSVADKIARQIEQEG